MKEYKVLNPDPDPDHYPVFLEKVNTMWANLPKWNEASFAKIPTLYNGPDAPLIWITDGDHDEGIIFETNRQMNTWVRPPRSTNHTDSKAEIVNIVL